MNRRSFLKASVPLAAASAPAENPAFRRRGYLGWITDLATAPDPSAEWPSMRLDATLLDDYGRTFDLMRAVGFNEISVWGFYVSRAWPLDVENSVPRARAAMVEKLIDAAHRRGIRVYSGLGVYSWGFDDIIQAHPELSRGNPHAMCASAPESWTWMRRVVDFVFKRFPIDGASMQSADQGRCSCSECRRYPDADYHVLLNTRVAQYIREQWPGKTVAVNSWGLRFDDPAALPALAKMSRDIDYLIDVHDTSRRRDPAWRRKLIASLACDFGTIGGPQVEPPQHWPRDRWFLPTPKRVGLHLEELFSDGGRACEFFFHILANPGCEITMRLAGRMLSDPRTGWQRHLPACVEEVFETPRPAVRDELAALVVAAEDAYFKHRPQAGSGTISLEPLVSASPGPPIYLTKNLTAAQRNEYAADLKTIAAGFEKHLPSLPRKDKARFVLRCLANVQADLTRFS
ncbi:MAG: hypothetical protein KIT09_33735 [Bryobacteraceae bacterium]|nr:hypothetical protein [Bryobacteraceae bacterium]